MQKQKGESRNETVVESAAIPLESQRHFGRQRAGRGERECPRLPSRVALRAKPWVGERSSAGYPQAATFADIRALQMRPARGLLRKW